MRAARLILEDGSVFQGEGFGSRAEAAGEVVFNTGMTGYQEVLSDPSYEGQIVAMTYPHIGNYGVNEQDPESRALWARGFVIRELPAAWSSWRGRQALDEHLEQQAVPGITGVDTRRLTRLLREKGAMRGLISSSAGDEAALLRKVREAPSMAGANLVDRVTCRSPFEWPAEGQRGRRFRVAAIDFGIKYNSLRELAGRGCHTTVYPASTPAREILASDPNGVFLSNGPGDPQAVSYAIGEVQKLLGKVPVFGICLGHQLIGLAAGLDTYKLRFGHHGSNHPVARLSDGAVAITTQNHGFAIRESAFNFKPPGGPGEQLTPPPPVQTAFGPAELTHVNLNDGTVEGFRLKDALAFCVQFHPEGGPGPHDSHYLFDDFCGLMEAASTDRKGIAAAG